MAMATVPDFSYFGAKPERSSNDQVTPFKVSVLVLIELFQKNLDDHSIFSQKAERDYMMLLLKLIQGADIELKELFKRLEGIKCSHLNEVLSEKLGELCEDGPSVLMDLFQSALFVFAEPNPPINKNSVIGLYIRQMLYVFDKLTFNQVIKLFGRYKRFFDAWDKSRPNEFNIYEKPFAVGLLDSSDLESSLTPEAKDEDETGDLALNDAVKYSRRQAELFLARQSTLLQHNESEALSPRNIHHNVIELLKGNPELAEAHFLACMNCLRLNEYVGAYEAMYHCFDLKLQSSNGMTGQSQKDKHEDDSLKPMFRYASLNMASLHYHFGHLTEARACVQEAIRLAQECNDHVCLQNGLSWLHRLNSDNSEASGFLLKRLMTKAVELNLPYLMSLGVQSYARYSAEIKLPPSKVFDMTQKSDIFNCQHSHVSLMCSSAAQKAALWQMYGKREMCSLSTQVLLNLETSDAGVYHNGEAECLGLCQLAILHADQGMYDEAFRIIDSAKQRYPLNTQHAKFWVLQEQLLIYWRAIHHGKWSIAEQSVVNMTSMSLLESRFCRCVLMKEKGDMSSALEGVISFLQQCKARKSDHIQLPEIQARLLILQAEIYCATSNPAEAVEPLLECISLSNEHYLSHLKALSMLHLAYVQYSLSMPQHALELVDKARVTILSHGSLIERAKAYYLYVKCKVAAAASSNDPSEYQRVVKEGASALDDVIKWFRSVEAHHRTKDAYYFQAKLYNELGCNAERNKCAVNFKLLDQQHPTWRRGQVLLL